MRIARRFGQKFIAIDPLTQRSRSTHPQLWHSADRICEGTIRDGCLQQSRSRLRSGASKESGSGQGSRPDGHRSQAGCVDKGGDCVGFGSPSCPHDLAGSSIDSLRDRSLACGSALELGRRSAREARSRDLNRLAGSGSFDDKRLCGREEVQARFPSDFPKIRSRKFA